MGMHMWHHKSEMEKWVSNGFCGKMSTGSKTVKNYFRYQPTKQQNNFLLNLQ